MYMKSVLKLTLLFFILQINSLTAQVSINTTNSNPDVSAMLDVASTDKGMLIPRMSTAQRDAIGSPATGLLVYDNNTDSFWFYEGAAWKELLAESLAELVDTDGDTKVQVEESADEDIIRFDVGGVQVAQFSKNANNDLLLQPSNSNVMMGSGAGGSNTGDSNVFIGRDAARINTTGRRNVVMGSQAGFSMSDSELNVYIGTIAGRDKVSGNRNVGIGDSAGSGPSGTSCTYLGTAAGAASGGDNNIFIGDSSGANNTVGNNNIMIGIGAGLSSTGSGNVLIGYFSGDSETGDNKLYIDNTGTNPPLIYGEFDNDLFKINGTLTATGITYPNGGIQFPNSFAVDPAYVGDTGNSLSFAHSGFSEDFLGYANNNFYFRDSPGGGDATQPSVYAQAFPTYSSRRWKHNIQDLTNALEVVQQLRGVTYTWNKEQGGKEDFGFIAEEVHTILPQIAARNAKGEIDGVEYGKITPYLVEAIKNQQLQIEALKRENETLQTQVAKIEHLETLLQALSTKVNVGTTTSEE